jgi:hypothetical protein
VPILQIRAHGHCFECTKCGTRWPFRRVEKHMDVP